MEPLYRVRNRFEALPEFKGPYEGQSSWLIIIIIIIIIII
jgi:hypothetical protein